MINGAILKSRPTTKSRIYFLYILMALTPVLSILIPWDFGPQEGFYRKVIAGNSLAIPIVELLLCCIFFRGDSAPKRFLNGTNKLDLLVLAIFLLSIAYVFIFVSVNPAAAALGLISLIVHALFAIGLYDVMRREQPWLFECFWTILGISVLVYTLLWAIDFSIYPPSESDWINRVPGVTNVRWAGFFWLSIFAAGLALINKEGIHGKLLAYVFGSFGLAMTLWTGSRGSLLAILAALSIAVLFFPKNRKTLAKYFLISLTFSVATNLVSPAPMSQYGMERILSSSQQTDDMYKVSSGRSELWASSLRIFLDNPVAGHGIDQFQRMGPRKTLGFKGPHSFPVQLLFSVGIIGLFSLLYAIFRMITIFKIEIRDPHQMAALAFFGGGSIYMLYDNFLYYPYPIAIYTISILMLLVPRKTSLPN